jgi:predicted transcriptional regulator
MRRIRYSNPTFSGDSMKVLLSIHPKYANLILNGIKKWEYRKHNFKKKVDTVFLYATSPIKKVVGEFTIDFIIEDYRDVIWKKTMQESGITEEEYYNYIKDTRLISAIRIKAYKRYKEPLELSALGITKAPQTFVYLGE